MTPEALDRALEDTPEAAGRRWSPTYFGAVADVAGLAEVGARARRAAGGRRGVGGASALPRGSPAPALSLGADLVISSTHKVVGSLTQSAMIHLGQGDLIEEVVDRCVTLVESTSPNSLLFGSLDAARRSAARGAVSWWRRRSCARADARFARSRGSTCSTSGWRERRACSTTTRSGSPSTSAGRT